MKRNLLAAIAIVALTGGALLVGCSDVPRNPQNASSTPSLATPLATAFPEGIISLGGETAPTRSPVQPSGEPLTIPGEAPSAPGAPTPAGKERSMDWPIYRDDTYGYEIRYPPNYIIQGGTQQKELLPLHQVEFQDRELAKSETAALQPPQFSIEVFDNSSRLPLEKWLKEHRVLEGWMKFQVEPYSLSGALGVRLSSQLLLAPNEFIYLPHGPYVFKLTPLGEFSEQMLATFKFIV